MELAYVDAAKACISKTIVAVVPYFGWARQDRKISQSCIGAKLIADILGRAGITVDYNGSS